MDEKEHDACTDELGEFGGNGKTNGRRKAKKSSQIQVPGTQPDASEALILAVERYARASLDIRQARKEIREVKPLLEVLMPKEEVLAISCELDCGEERHRVFVALTEKRKLEITIDDDEEG